MHLLMKLLMQSPGPHHLHRLPSLVVFWLFLFHIVNNITAAEDPTPPITTGNVGMSIELEQVVISGSELEVVPLSDEQQPIVLRIEAVWPHGSDFRYDFSFYGLEPGTFDLKSQLRRKDGSTINDVQPLPVLIESLLPAGNSEPAALNHRSIPVPGGYKQWMTSLGIVWLLGLIGISWSMRRQKNTNESEKNKITTLSLGEKLEPLVKSAASGNISSNEKAELERLLLSFWSQQLDLKDLKSSQRIQKLKEHPEAKVLICAVEKWLHSPESVDENEIKLVLRPYHSIQWKDGAKPLEEVKV